MAIKEQSALRGVPFNLNKNDFTRENYDFLGWNTDPNATEIQYEDEDEVAFSDDTILYAIWKRHTLNYPSPE